MRFLLLMIDGALTRDWPVERGRAAYERMLAWTRDLEARGMLVMAHPLRPDAEGARIRSGTGTPVVTDGPFVETKEVVGGFVMISCSGRKEAVAIARGCPAAEWGTVEVRQMWEEEPWGRRGD